MTALPHHHKYLNGLNGLRALAAGTVLLGHIHDGLPSLGLPFFGRTQCGLFAVTVFFALSGFLITHLLLREKESTGKIGIKNFYIRRTLRIWPLYFFFFGCALLFNYLVDEPYDKSLILYTLLFAGHIPNCLNHFIGNAGHLWSLGVEEQFYLIWPWLIRFSKRPIVALSVFLILFFVVKGIARFAFGGEHPVYYFFYITRFDCMAIGGIAAWLHLRGIPAQLRAILFSLPVQISCWLCLLAVIPDKFHVFSFLDHFLIAVVTSILILNLIANPRPLFRLENRLLRYLGGISFGLYMWHSLIIASNVLLLPHIPFPVWGKITFLTLSVVGETILVAHLSKKFLEQPFLRFKDRFAVSTLAPTEKYDVISAKS